MESKYKPQEVEPEIYRLWEKGSFFQPSAQGDSFTIIMPPPNANGHLHIGHALFVTLEDIMTRYQRMRGRAALWLPGADHAAIATQVSFEKELAKKGKTRFDLGRERFYEEVMKFTLENKKAMEDQLRALGASCDWSREKFTLDPELVPPVYKVFKMLWDDKLVYRGERIVNWCPRCGTALSDLEVIYQEHKTHLWYINYPLADSSGRFITVATTRPETMLGDSAVAVNPSDARYQNLIGSSVRLPLNDRLIPIIASDLVDKDFGAGALKVTPAHDETDWEIGQAYNLPVVNVINKEGRLENVPEKYIGLPASAARKLVAADLEQLGLLSKVEELKHRLSVCERCKTPVEPQVSKQWYIDVKPLAQKALEAVNSGQVELIPSFFNKTFFHWMENIKPWCISRQIWWGIRLPIWYCSFCGDAVLGINETGAVKVPEKCGQCGNTSLVQDEDTFDTWFSSGQWPYTTLGWPDDRNGDFARFYPTSVMETGYEILFFWVARMLMLGLYVTGQVPFKTVYLHGMVRDVQGKKMSKSKPETHIDPLEVVNKYGADALRMALVIGTSPGKDMSLGEEKIKGYRNFTNKIWNASRLFQINLEKATESGLELNFRDWDDPRPSPSEAPPALNRSRTTGLGSGAEDEGERAGNKDDQQILAELSEVIKKTTDNLDHYQFSSAGEALYEFFWHRFCDWYLEAIKSRLKENDQAAYFTFWQVLRTCLKLLHPFAPFVTEAVWQELKFSDKMLIEEAW